MEPAAGLLGIQQVPGTTAGAVLVLNLSVALLVLAECWKRLVSEVKLSRRVSATVALASSPPVGLQKAEVVCEAAAHTVAPVAPQELSWSA